MTKPYADFDPGDNHEDNDDDDDIGALGSILSWDEDEEGAEGNAATSALSDRESMNGSALPDLVSFNMKDGGLAQTYLHQLSTTPGSDSSNLTIPMPTPINFSQPHSTLTSPQTATSQHKQPQTEQNVATNAPKTQSTLVEAPANHVQQQVQQQQAQVAQQVRQQVQQQQSQQSHIQQQQQQQIQQQQQQIQQQQLQIQQQQQLQQLMAAPASVPQPRQQQQQLATQSGTQQTQASQQPGVPQSLTQAGAFTLFQQNALLAQSQNTKQQPMAIGGTMPTIMLPGVAQPNQEQRSDPAAQYPAFPADPSAFLRQLQVAQLQQQFSQVQQGRPLTQQVIRNTPQTAQVPAAALQQQIQFQTQVPMVAQVPMQAAAPAASAPKKARASQSKKPPATKNPPPLQAELATSSSKSAIVSASDTDGEVSMNASSTLSKAMKKSSSGKAADFDLSNLTPEEKAKANRDRNREHARNTRLRKKAYLEKLKVTVDELCRERDTLVSERAGAANILVEMHNTRTEVLMSFFALRSSNEKRRELWASILDESCFACVMPVTPYRSFPASEVQVSKCQRTILGIDGMMSDTASLHVLLNSLVDRSRFPTATIVSRYTLVTEEAVVAGNQMMTRWVMSTLNATQCGARMEVAKQGMLCCKFNSAHKIIGLELMFDVMALMLQLKQAAGSETFSVIPNTVQTCQRSFDKPMVMTLAEEPYTIVQVNKLWEDMTGYKAEEVVGKTSCRILEGEETDSSAVDGLMNEVRFKRPSSAMVVHYKKTGERFRNFFLSYPLSTDSRITHYLCLSNHVDTVISGKADALCSQQGKQQVLQPPKTAAAITEPSVQPNFYAGMQNLQGSASAGQAALSHPGSASQQLFTLPPVLSNSLAPAPASILPPCLGAPASIQQYSMNTLKRPRAVGKEPVEPQKQAKTATAETSVLMSSVSALPK